MRLFLFHPENKCDACSGELFLLAGLYFGVQRKVLRSAYRAILAQRPPENVTRRWGKGVNLNAAPFARFPPR
jgi:hypothetical protein